ncbi:non-ribosomal peptide synthetase, partial [Clostridium beijerinckii]
FINHYLNILKVIVENREIELKEIDILSEEERHQILYEFNDTKADYPKDKTIQELFEEQVEKTPDNIAIVFEDKKLTYRELNEKSNSLARLLREKGVRPNSIVGIMVERSPEMIIGIMGILKSGGAYLPIDPTNPKERIEYMLFDSDSNILLSRKNLLIHINYNGEIIDLNDSDIFLNDTNNLELTNKSSDLVYVIYTSGTTGKPKGAMIEHRSLVNRLNWMQKKYPISEEDTILQKTTYTFDVSVWEIIWWSLVGAKVCILRPEAEKSPIEIMETIENNEITTIHFVPSMLEVFMDYVKENDLKEKLKSIKKVFSSGEELKRNQVIKFYNVFDMGNKLTNLYGPTEATIDVSYFDCINKERAEIPIGKPIYNTQLYVLHGRKVTPIGIAGELWISGDGLSRGYLNRQELTEEKFVENPFVKGNKMYKTGDLARWLPDGNVEFLGRIDDQVKIRGFRIELNEIESRLLEHENIKESIVLAKEDKNGGKYLCAYVVSNDNIDDLKLKSYLKESLPEYMIPSVFVELEELPLTRNGKVDKRALPEPNLEMGLIGYEAPRNEVEEILVEVYSEVLGVEKVGINDNFFKLGGDSIKAIQLSARVLKHGYILDVKDIFKNAEIKEISGKVKVKKMLSAQTLIEGLTELTPIQMWFFENKISSISHFNQSVMLLRKNGFEAEKVRAVFNKIFEHHDALRMSYIIDEFGIKQITRNVENILYNFMIFDFRGQIDCKNEIEEKCEKMQESLDINKGNLVNLGLFKTDEGDHLAIIIHHLIIDGISWRILFEDFSTGYSQLLKGKKINFQEKTTSYMEWAKELKKYSESEEVLKEIKFWGLQEKSKARLKMGEQEKTNLKIRKREVINLEFSKSETNNILKNVNSVYNTEINDILLTTLVRTLKEYAVGEEILIGLEGHGREGIIENIDHSRTVGWFTTIYPVVFISEKNLDISREIRKVKETLRRVPNKGIGYGILKYLTKKDELGDLKFTLRPEVMFNYLGQFDEDISKKIFEISDISTGKNIAEENTSNRLMEISGLISDKKLRLSFDFDANRIDSKTMNNFRMIFKINLQEIIEHCINKNEKIITPSDISNNSLSIDDLDDFIEELQDYID